MKGYMKYLEQKVQIQ